MLKRSSKKNKYVKAASLLVVLSLCLGGFFVFSSCGAQNAAESVSTAESEKEKRYFLPYDTSSAGMPDVSAKSAVLIEASSGEVIFEKNADERLPMASTTKIMTALVAIESCELKKEISVSPEAVGVEGSSIYLYPGETLTLEDLLYALLLESANDAAAAIAIEIGGSIEGFADMMNKKARELGLERTHFENPHGLDSDTHYTTARELAVIARAAYSNESFKKIVSTYKKTIPLKNDEGVRLLINHNKLLKSYSGATGIKTGFTKKSGRCLVSSAERDGLEFIAVTLNAPNDWQDHTNLLDYGFSQLQSKTLCEIGEFSYILPAVSGDCDHVKVENAEKVTIILSQSEKEIEYEIELDRFVYAPIKTGQIMGRIVFYLNGKEIADSKLVARTSVSLTDKKSSFFDRFKLN